MELPGLRGFSERNLKNMRTFYEEWQMLDNDLAVTTADLQLDNNDGHQAEKWQLQLPNFKGFPAEEFFKIGFTHHTIKRMWNMLLGIMKNLWALPHIRQHQICRND